LQLCQDIRGGVIGRRDAQRTYGVSANLIQLWLTQFDRGELNDEEAEASVIAEYEAQIAALERKVSQLTMELDLLKKTPRQSIADGSEKSSAARGLLCTTRAQDDRSPEKQLSLPFYSKVFQSQRYRARRDHRRHSGRITLLRLSPCYMSSTDGVISSIINVWRGGCGLTV